MKRWLILLAAGFMVWLALSTAEAATIYLDANCGDVSTYDPTAAPGSRCTGGSDTVRDSANECIALLTPGDTCQMAGGTSQSPVSYVRATTYPTEAGASWSNFMTVKPFPGEYVIWTGGNAGTIDAIPDVSKFYKLLGERTGIRGKSNFKIDGCALRWGAPDDMWVEGLEITGCPRSCVQGGNGLRLINNEIHHCGLDGKDHGAYLASSSDSIIRGNWFHHNSGCGMHLYNGRAQAGYPDPCTPDVRQTDATPNGCGLVGNLIEGNLFESNIGCGLYNNTGMDNNFYNNVSCNEDYIVVNSLNAKVFNNSIHREPAGGGGACNQGSLRILGHADNAIVRNNLVWGTPQCPIYIGPEATGVTDSDNLTGTFGSPLDPKITDLATCDFRLQADSPAVDAGATLAEVTTDFNGVARPQGPSYDIGAFELGGGGGAPVPPFDFSVSNEGDKSLDHGDSVQNIITVTTTAGTAAAVSFSATQVSGLPTGATISFSAASCTPSTPCQVTATIDTLVTTPGGTPGQPAVYPITIRGQAGSTTRTTGFNLTVNCI